MVSQERIEHVRTVKKRHEAALLQKANVVGVGIGLDDEASDELVPVIIVNVTHKVPWHELASVDRVPKELEGVPVEVEAVGHLRAQRHQD